MSAARGRRYMGVPEVAERYGLSRAFVANILKCLCRQGYVVSHRGIKGGYALQPGMMQRSLADLMEDLDDSFRLAECSGAAPSECCQLYDACPVKGPVAEVNRRLHDVLDNVTLAELFGIAPERLACQALQLV